MFKYRTIIIIIFILFLICFINKDVIKEEFINKNKVAFIFLTVGDVKQHNVWKIFFKDNYDRTNIYVHPKFPEKVTSFFKDYIIDDRIPTQWGDVSLVESTNILIDKALKNPSNKKIILVSDSCIPIKKFNYIYNAVLEDKKSWLNYYKPDYKQGSMAHLRRTNLINSKFHPNVYINEQWMILDRKHAETLSKNKHLIEYFRTPRLIPDEIYYITALHHINKNIKNELKFDINNRENYVKHQYINYAKWYDPIIKKWQTKHPFEYDKMNKYDILMMKQTKALFARKFSPESNIIKYWNFITK